MSSLCGYSDAYILVKGTISRKNTSAEGEARNNNDKKVILKYCAPFTERINKINKTQVDKTESNVIVMLIYNLVRYSNNCSKAFEILYH